MRGLRHLRGERRVAKAARAPAASDRTTRAGPGASDIPRHAPSSVGTTWKRVSQRDRASATASPTPRVTKRSRDVEVDRDGLGGEVTLSAQVSQKAPPGPLSSR